MAPLNPQIEALLAQLPHTQDLDFMRLVEAIHAVRYTGSMTIAFRNGTPQQINLGQPVTLSICHGDRAGGGGGVDKPPRTRAG